MQLLVLLLLHNSGDIACDAMLAVSNRSQVVRERLECCLSCWLMLCMEPFIGIQQLQLLVLLLLHNSVVLGSDAMLAVSNRSQCVVDLSVACLAG